MCCVQCASVHRYSYVPKLQQKGLFSESATHFPQHNNFPQEVGPSVEQMGQNSGPSYAESRGIVTLPRPGIT